MYVITLYKKEQISRILYQSMETISQGNLGEKKIGKKKEKPYRCKVAG